MNNKSRLFYKILSFFLSLIIPVILIGLITHSYSRKLICKNYSYRIEKDLESSVATIDIYIQVSQETMANFFLDSDINRLFLPKKDHTDWIKTELWKIPRILNRSENIVNNFAYNTFAYIDDALVYAYGGVVEFDLFFEKFNRYTNYSKSFWVEMQQKPTGFSQLEADLIDSWNPSETAGVIPLVMSKKIGTEIAVIVLNLSLDSIRNALCSSSIFQESTFFIFDMFGNPLFYDFDCKKSFNELEWNSYSDKGIIDIEGNDYFLSHHQSDFNGWIYFTVTPASVIYGESTDIVKMLLVISIVLVVMGVIFSFIFTYNLYNPIRNIRDILISRDNRLLEPTSPQPNEIDFIRERFQTLIRENNLIISNHKNSTHEYIFQTLSYLLDGQPLHDEEMNFKDTLKAEFGFIEKGYICACILFEFEEKNYKAIQDTERMEIISEIEHIIHVIMNKQTNCYTLHYRQNLFTCIINASSELEIESVKNSLGEIFSSFAGDSKYYSMTAGIGSFVESLNDISLSHNRGMSAIGSRLEKKRFELIDSADISIQNTFLFSFMQEQKLLNNLKLMRREDLEKDLNTILSENITAGTSWNHMNMLCREILTIGLRFALERGIVSDFKRPLLKDLNNVEPGNVHEIKILLMKYFLDLLSACESKNQTKPIYLASMITEYIESNYNKDLCLEMIADALIVSPKYVSRVFHEHTGTTINSYINKFRIEKAKKLILSTNMSMAKIASDVGIHNRSTFLRVFRKMEGMSPTEYRLAISDSHKVS